MSSFFLKEIYNAFPVHRERLVGGLSKLSDAESMVGSMQEELVALGPKIEEKARVSSWIIAR